MLSAIVINFRSSEIVNECVRALLASTTPPDEVLVVDNEGTDGGLEPELAARSDVLIDVRPDNPGYAAACNAGARLARGDHLLFMNADVTVDSGCLERCRAVIESDRSIGVVTCRLVRPNGDLDHAAHRGIPTPIASIAYKLRLHRIFPRSRRLARYTLAWLDPATDHDVEACSGAFMLVSRAALEDVGGWDERYRFYAEDLDLCVRIGRSGRRVRYVGTTSATHIKGAFSNRHAPDATLDPAQLEVKKRVAREIAASHRLFFEEHIRPANPPVLNAAMRVMFAVDQLRLGAAKWLSRA